MPPTDRMATARADDEQSGPSGNPGGGPAWTGVSRAIRPAGRWYYLVLIGSAGVLAWIPFLHAAIRLKTVRSRQLALAFGLLDAALYVLLTITPEDAQGHLTDGPLTTIGGLIALCAVAAGCVAVGPLRRAVYGLNSEPAPGADLTSDPAIKAVLAARARREAARKLATDDPSLARELHIGRPDIARNYDDGGLVDLNSAPAELIATVCDIPSDVAATIVQAREQRGGPFSNVDEMLVFVELPVTMWDRIRERAILLP